MKCPVCGAENNNRFCTQCGTKLQPVSAMPVIAPTVAKKPNYKPLIGGTILLACILVFVLLIVNSAKGPDLPYLEYNGEIYKYGMDIELPTNTTITTITYNADSSEETIVRYFSPDYDTRIYLDINEKTGNHVIVGFAIEDSSTASIGGLSIGDTYAKVEKKYPKIDHYMLDVEWEASWTSDFLGTEITDHEKQYGKRSYVAVWDENEYALFFMSNKKYDGKKFVKAYPKIHPEQVLHVTTRHNGYVESISFGDFSIYKRAKNIEDLWPW
ncbi:MAG: zinc ribbon domain-containing protein [Clostridia bacterium]|nr:zinc ribbon domain-containing protein [Clostridia bacterium]